MSERCGPVVLALVLAACGGGGSAVTPPGSSGSPGVQQASVQRSLASQALFDTQTTTQIAQFGGGGSLGTLSVLRRSVDAAITRGTSAVRTTLAACNGSLEITSTPVGTTETQIHEQTFYDSGCTLLFQDIHLDVVASGTSGTLNGTETQFTRTGDVFAYNTISGKVTGVGSSSAQLSVQITDAANSTSPQIALFGLSCNVALTSQACGSGVVEHQASSAQDFGATFNANVSGLTVSGGTTIVFNGNGAAYKGAFNALTLSQGAFPSWSIAGGTLTDTLTISGQLTFNGAGILTGGSLTLFDSGADATVSVVASGSPLTISGVIKQTDNGQTMATFTVDIDGNGTITFSNGTTAQIIAWQIVG